MKEAAKKIPWEDMAKKAGEVATALKKKVEEIPWDEILSFRWLKSFVLRRLMWTRRRIEFCDLRIAEKAQKTGVSMKDAALSLGVSMKEAAEDRKTLHSDVLVSLPASKAITEARNRITQSCICILRTGSPGFMSR